MIKNYNLFLKFKTTFKKIPHIQTKIHWKTITSPLNGIADKYCNYASKNIDLKLNIEFIEHYVLKTNLSCRRCC